MMRTQAIMIGFILYFLLGLFALGTLVAVMISLYPQRPAQPPPRDPADPSSPGSPPAFLTNPPSAPASAADAMILKTNSISVKCNKDKVEFVVDGVTYHHAAEIPDPHARRSASAILQELMTRSSETQSETLSVAVQESRGQKRYVVNGIPYGSLGAIPEDSLREKVRLLIGLNLQALPKEKILIEFINDKVLFTVNGVAYSTLQAIPDAETRRCAEEAFIKLWEAQMEQNQKTEAD